MKTYAELTVEHHSGFEAGRAQIDLASRETIGKFLYWRGM